jgi:hypothetical protein
MPDYSESDTEDSAGPAGIFAAFVSAVILFGLFI